MKDSRTLRSLTRAYELICIRAICGGSGRTPVFRSMRKGLERLIRKRKADPKLAKPLWDMARRGYRATRRMDPAEAVGWFESEGIVATREMEAAEKGAWLKGLLSEGVFYVCSEHGDCAEDHAAYQGRLYVSSHWKERVSDPELRKRIAACIRNKGLEEIEWAIGEPVWLTTRPNCRHMLARVPTEEALSSSVRSLVGRYAPTEAKRDYGDPLKGRLRLLEALGSDGMSTEIARQIAATKMRIRKNRKR